MAFDRGNQEKGGESADKVEVYNKNNGERRSWPSKRAREAARTKPTNCCWSSQSCALSAFAFASTSVHSSFLILLRRIAE